MLQKTKEGGTKYRNLWWFLSRLPKRCIRRWLSFKKEGTRVQEKPLCFSRGWQYFYFYSILTSAFRKAYMIGEHFVCNLRAHLAAPSLFFLPYCLLLFAAKINTVWTSLPLCGTYTLFFACVSFIPRWQRYKRQHGLGIEHVSVATLVARHRTIEP